ncbi:MAG: phenylalanine--tRNA ligase subunit beta [Gammaproteobacteria bacterium]|nr:phenylalanine--tRNA ligase subunit beta [Gammaproteobacteria bacterium]
MKFSEQWLREWVDPPLDTKALVAQLTMAGIEVEAVEPVAAEFNGVVVGRVEAVEPHPQADRLRVCRVDVGADAPLTIVCGAANVAPGMCVPAALVGARLPGGLTISRAKLRGVESFGMLCSAKELGLAETSEGLLPLPACAKPGVDVRELLALDDVSLELSLTPNRSDCLGIAGIAREIAALNRIDMKTARAAEVPAAIDVAVKIEVATPEACPRYLGRVIRGIDPAAESPLWLRERLRRSGLRSLGPVVDVTNYLLLELGQPMHAFDLARIDGGIRVRQAENGETFTSLDGQTLALRDDMLVVANHQGVLALAGIIGGAQSAVNAETTSILLECAFFAPAAITGRARRLGLHTESSHRFERGVDPELQAQAMERATQLILDIAGGEAGPVVAAMNAEFLPCRSAVMLRAARLERLLGYRIPAAEVQDILVRLGMRVEAEGDGVWQVTPPSFRFDIAIEADLIEELARVHGYERLPSHRPSSRLEIRAHDAHLERVRRGRHLLADRGYQEVITYSFVDAGIQRLLDPVHESLALANPLAADIAVMRTSLWTGLIQAGLHNLKRQQARVRLFEYGRRYTGALRSDDESGAPLEQIKEEAIFAGIAIGTAYPEQWGLPGRGVDFYDVKADVDALLEDLGRGHACGFEAAMHPALHPGQSARILDSSAREIGWLGALHPETADALGFGQSVFVFELNLDTIESPKDPSFTELSKFPSVRRDLAIIVDECVTAAELDACVRDSAGNLLQGLHLFDIYRGKGVDSGKKSIALGLTLQDFSRTLTDVEVDALIEGVLKQLHIKLRATLRE